MKKVKDMMILGVIVVVILIISGIGSYLYFYSENREQEKKPVVYLPTKYGGNLTFEYYGEGYVTYFNKTPLAKYWYREYLKNHKWSVKSDGISMVVYLKHMKGDEETQNAAFEIILNSSKYIERVIYISNGIETAKKNRGDVMVSLVDEKDYEDKREYIKFLALPGDNSVGMIVSWRLGMSNISFRCTNYVHIDERNTKDPLPYNFTAYVETKDKIYRFQFKFNITDDHYPFVNIDFYYEVPNVTYYCYIPSENKVVISDHIVNGTKYFFVEKDGFLSKIVEVRI